MTLLLGEASLEEVLTAEALGSAAGRLLLTGRGQEDGEDVAQLILD